MAPGWTRSLRGMGRKSRKTMAIVSIVMGDPFSGMPLVAAHRPLARAGLQAMQGLGYLRGAIWTGARLVSGKSPRASSGNCSFTRGLAANARFLRTSSNGLRRAFLG